MKKKVNSNSVKNGLLRFEQYLANNLANGGNNGVSIQNFYNKKNSLYHSQPLLSSKDIINLEVNPSMASFSSSVNDINYNRTKEDSNMIDTNEIKANIDSISTLNISNIKIFTTYFANISKLKEITSLDYFASITSYFSNWSDIFIKFFKQFSIEYEIPSCPDYIENIKIHETDKNENIYDISTSDANNIRNCMLSLYKWNYLFLRIMKFVEERENRTKKIVEHYKTQVEHIQLLKEVVNQKYGKDSSQSIIHKFIIEKKKFEKNIQDKKKNIYINIENEKLFDEKKLIVKKEAETQTRIVEYDDKAIETNRTKCNTQSIQTSINGNDIEENFNSLKLMSSKVKSLELSKANSINELSDLKESFKKKEIKYKEEMENKVSSMQCDYDQLKNSENTLKDKLNILSENYEKLKNECEFVNSSNERLNEIKNQNEMILSENKKTLEKLEGELLEKETELNEINDEYKEYKKNCTESLETKTTEISNLKNKVKALEKDIKIQKLKETELTEEIEIWKDNEKKLKDTYGNLHYSLLMSQEENKNFKKKLEEYESKCKNSENKIKELQSNLYNLVENSNTEINSSILVSESNIEEKIAANNIKISLLEEINDKYRKIQLEKINVKSINLKEKIEKSKKAQETFENEKLKKLLQKSKSYEDEINNYFNNYSSCVPERKRNIRSASSVVTVESADDESSYVSSKNDHEDIKANLSRVSSSSTINTKNYSNNINSILLSQENNGNNKANNYFVKTNGDSNNYTANNHNIISPKNRNISNNNINNNNNNNNNNRFPNLNKDNEVNNNIFWNAPKKNNKTNNIYPTTYTSSIKMAEIIYKNYPKSNNKFPNSNNSNISSKNNKINTNNYNKTPIIRTNSSLITANKSNKPKIAKILINNPTKYPPSELSKYITSSKIPNNKYSYNNIINYNEIRHRS